MGAFAPERALAPQPPRKALLDRHRQSQVILAEEIRARQVMPGLVGDGFQKRPL